MSSKIRFLHACPCLDVFDVYSYDDCIICPSLLYKQYTDYYDICHGKHIFKICKPKKKFYSLLDAYTYVSEKSYQTAIVTGNKTDLSFFVVPDAYIPISYNKAFIRFANLAPDSPDLDFTFLDNSYVIFEDVEYKEVTDYYPLYADNYTIVVKNTTTKQEVLRIYNVKLQPNRFYTIYVFGFIRDSAPRYLITTDGAS